MRRAIECLILAYLTGLCFGGGCVVGARATGAIKPRQKQEVSHLRAEVYEIQEAVSRLDRILAEEIAGRVP